MGHRRLTHARDNGDIIPVPVGATPGVVAGAGLVLASYDGFVRFQDSLLRKTYWEVRLESAIYAPVTVDPYREAFLVCALDGTVTRFGLKGDVEWSVRFENSPAYAAPLVMGKSRTLILVTFGSRCIFLDLDDGSVRFELQLPKPWHAALNSLSGWRDPYASPVAATDDSFILCCGEWALHLAVDGTVLWKCDLGRPVRASPAYIAQTDQVLIAASDGSCHLLDIRTGQRRDGPRLGGRIVASPAVSEGMVVIGTMSGTILGWDANAGAIAWSIEGSAPRDHSSFHTLPNGDFVVTTERGSATAFGRDDGCFIWETDQRTGDGDQDPRMDITPVTSRDGHMYCASYTGHIYAFRFRDCNEA